MALGRNITFPIYNDDGTSFHGLELRRSSVESLVMSLSDRITGDAYYDGGVELEFTMKEYVMYNNVKYTLVSPPTIVREGMTADNSELKGTTKYSFEFYHPMYWLANYPFSDIAVTSSESRYKSHDKSFSWIGTIVDYVAKLNKNLEGTEWVVAISSRVPQADLTKLSEVLTFNDNSIADALKTAYDTYALPYVIDSIKQGETYYSQGKRFLISFGLPPNEIYDSGNIPYVFQFGKGVGLKNNSRTPRKNKIITRIAGYGSETNIPYGYPQIVWTGSQDATETADGYPLYDGIVGGLVVKLIKHPFTRSHLMPSVYVDRVRKKVNSAASDYNPNIELIDYYDADSSYPNPINPVAPNYEIHEFGDIKPELGQESIVSATPLNQDLTPASDWDDTMDDDGNYLQSYFQITLPILSFDIYACAAITEAMQINMRSGGCIGCTFDVQVDWDDYKKNFFDSQGNFLPNGTQRDLTKYPKSNEGQISIIVQKDLNTFGTLMPNRYQYPQSGDDFVVLGISLPTSYITSAQTRLDSAMQSFMLANNVHYFDYPLKFDEYFLATRTDLLSQIRNNSILRFAFGSEELELFVKQIVIKYGQGVLPQYDITLTDDIEVVLNQIGQVQEDVDNLTSVISALRQSFSNNVWVELSKKLSKVSDDTARGFITFLQGLQVGQRFVSGLLGEGGVFRKNQDGTTYIEADSLYIRMKAYFDTLEVRKLQYSSGNRVASAAGIKTVKVEKVGMYNGSPVTLDENGYYHYTDGQGQEQSVQLTVTAYRCYFRMSDSDGNPIDNDFVAGDLARSQEFNLQSGLRGYWRKVVRTNGQTPDEDGLGWIDLSNVSGEYLSGSGEPTAQDDIVQLGNVNDTGRQGAIIEYSTGAGNVPSYQIYQGINTFSLENKNKIDLGYNPSTGRAYLNVYGDFFFGNNAQSGGQYTGSYIKYNSSNGELEIKGKITATSTIGNQSIDQYIDGRISQAGNWTQEEIETLIVDTTSSEFSDLETAIETLQNQADGAIETWFYNGVPTLSNLPASEWNTTELKDKHLGDLYYDNASGMAYRFTKTGNVYSWNLLSDSAVAKALADAAEAQDTADHKRRVFVTTPTPPYDNGDLWVNATYPSNATSTDASNNQYCNDLLKCITPKGENGSFSITDWGLASKYTDDSALNSFISGTYSTFVTQIQGQVDAKAETWYQNTDPSTAWTTTELKNAHVGDIWHNSSSSTINGVEAGQDAIWNGTSWSISTVPSDVYDKIDGKADIFVSRPTTYNANDMWIIESGLSSTYMPSGCQAGDIVIASNSRTNAYTKGDWTKKDRYTDDSSLNTFISGTYQPFADAIQTQVDGKAETWVMSANPASQWTTTALKDEHVGDMWLNTSNETIASVGTMQTAIYTKSGSTYSWVVDNNIPNSVFDKIDGKRSIYVTFSSITTAMSKSALQARDLYIPSSTETKNSVTYTKNKVYRCTNVGAYSGGAITTYPTFVEVAYTDDTTVNYIISNYGTILGITSPTAANVGQALGYLREVLGGNTTTDGGLILSHMIALKNGTQIMSGMNGTLNSSLSDPLKTPAAWYGGAMVDYETLTSSQQSNWNSSKFARSLFRFDGSGYLASGNITWNENGAVTIKNITTLSDSQNTNLLNELATFNSAFSFATSGQGSTTALSITPNVPFTSLKVLENNVARDVATQNWVSTNYITSLSRVGDVLKMTKNGVTSDVTRILERGFTYSYSGVQEVGWYRVGALSRKAASGNSCLLLINRVFSYGSNEAYIFAITQAYNGGISISQLAGHYNTQIIDKIRVEYVTDNSDFYSSIDFHVGADKGGANGYTATIVGSGRVNETLTFNPTLTGSTIEYNVHKGIGSNILQIGDCEVTWDATNQMLKFSKGIYSQEGISALGANNSGGGGGGSSTLAGLSDVNISNIQSGQILSWNGSKWVNTTSGSGGDIDMSTLNAALSNYYTKNETDGKYYALYGANSLNLSESNTLDLNTLITIGSHYNGYNLRARYCTNRPTNNDSAFRVYVSNPLGIGTNYIRQRYQEYNSNDAYERMSYNSGSTWDNWVQVQGNMGSYLPLSGGTLTGSLTSTYFRIKFLADTSQERGYIWYNTSDVKVAGITYHNTAQNIILNPIGSENTYSDSEGKYSLFVGNNKLTYNTYPILHSNNYTTYTVTKTGTGASGTWGISITGSAASLATARDIWGQSFNGSTNVKGDLYLLSDESGTSINTSSARLKFNSLYADSSETIYRSPYIQALYYGNYGRKRLGVFQSNATNYTDGFNEVLSILPNGNIGIGTTSPEYKLVVDGSIATNGQIFMPNNKVIYWKDNPSSGDATNMSILEFSSSNNLHVGYGSSALGYPTYISGNNIYLRYGTSRTTGLTIGSDGKVTIPSSGKLVIGGCTIEWDATNSMLKFDKGIYSSESVSALGSWSGGGTPVTTLEQLSDTSISNKQTNQVLMWNGSKWVNGSAPSSIDMATLNAALSNYLPLSGGTMTGSVSFNATNKGIFLKDSGGNSYAALINNAENLWIGANATSGVHHLGGTFISAGSGSAYISRLVDNTRTNYIILDSGNYSSYALPLSGGTLTGSLTINGGITFGGGDIKFSVDTSQVRGFDFRDTSNSSIAKIYYHNTAQNVIINPLGSSSVCSDAVGNYSLFVGNNKLTYNTYSILHAGNAVAQMVSLLGNGTGDFTDETEVFSSYADANGFTGHPNNIYKRPASKMWNYVKSKITADTALNVASATKLATARTIWGQSFDGTTNVSGALSNTGTITPSTAVTYNLGSNTLSYKYVYATWVGAPSSTELKLGANNANHICVATDGKVGIGTMTPSYKLEVNGEAKLLNFAFEHTNELNCYYNNGDGNFQINYRVAGNVIFCTGGGMVGVGRTPSTKLDVSGATRATNFSSTVTDGTAPFYASATTLCTNVNADLLDGWHLSNIKPSGWMYSNTASLSNYWCKLWSIDMSATKNSDRDITLLLQRGYSNYLGIIHVNVRQTGDATNGYAFADSYCYVRERTGNIPSNLVRLYLNTNNGTCELWINCSAQWGAFGATILRKAGFSGVEYSEVGTMYSTQFTTAQTLPSGTGISYKEMTYANIYTGDITSTNFRLLNSASNPDLRFQYAYNSTNYTYYVQGYQGYLYLGSTSTKSFRIDSNGNCYTPAEMTAASDIRFKSVISEVNTRVEDAATLPIFYFKWKNGRGDDNMHIGTSAQEVRKLFPELVIGGEELSVNYATLGTILGVLNARKLTKHEERIIALEKENKRLRAEINELKGVA